jgi:IclR family pca regulon transcriptional regulator
MKRDVNDNNSSFERYPEGFPMTSDRPSTQSQDVPGKRARRSAAVAAPSEPPSSTRNAGRCSERDFVTSLARGLAVIQAFTNQQHEMSISKISQKTGIARAAVRRYLYTLASLGYVVTRDGCRFSLLPKVVTLGRAYLSATPLPTTAQQHLDVLAEEIGEACSLGVLDGVDIVYLARANSSSVMSPRFNVGERLPAYCTSIGHVLFANLASGVLEERLQQVRFVPYTRHTIISPATLLEYLGRVREEGFAIADQQLEAGFRTIAVPVRNRAQEIVAGINVIVPISRGATAQLKARYLGPLTETAGKLSEALAI